MQMNGCILTSQHLQMLTKSIEDLNMMNKAVKLLEKNTQVNLNDLGFGNGSLAITPKCK
jgi:hypothetical protein